MDYYSIQYKKELPLDEPWGKFFDITLFLSAYNSSERVISVFEKVNAAKKEWLAFPEYCYSEDELPEHACLCKSADEGQQISDYFANKDWVLKDERICIDITGFMRPQLAFLIRYLFQHDVKKVDMIYSEPDRYSKKESTDFSDGNVVEVRQILGFEGGHVTDTNSDILIVGAGYDYNLIKSVCNHKENAQVVPMVGFPSLRADMYQENILKITQAADSIGDDAILDPLYAPANDPFITASVISKKISNIKAKKDGRFKDGYSNLYLCPLATKPQAVGFVLCYLKELLREPASILFPYFKKYSRETSKGLSRVWKYTYQF